VNGLPLQETRRKDSQQKCAAAGGWPTSIARLEQSTLGGHDRWIWEYSWLSDTGSYSEHAKSSFLVASMKDCSGGPKIGEDG
jgi:hypothetical protein